MNNEHLSSVRKITKELIESDFVISKVKGYFENLKECSVILTTSFYDINQEMLTKKEGVSKISHDSNVCLQVIYHFVHWHCFIDYCVK